MAKGIIQTPVVAFTAKAAGQANVLVSQVKVSHAFNPPDKKTHPKKINEYTAIWDTGASSTVITKKVVTECGLKPIGMAKVYTASGEDVTPVYMASVFLPNKVLFPNVRVNEGKIVGNVEMLIGMDIIGSGDFAVTNKDGLTMFSFRMPSIEHIDFVERLKAQTIPVAKTFKKPGVKIGRNAPCPCGSGKKYKKCHG